MRIQFPGVFQNSEGNALIETAITLPSPLLKMFGVIDFACIFAIPNSMQTVSSETARLVAIRRILDQRVAQDRVIGQLRGGN